MAAKLGVSPAGWENQGNGSASRHLHGVKHHYLESRHFRDNGGNDVPREKQDLC